LARGEEGVSANANDLSRKYLFNSPGFISVKELRRTFRLFPKDLQFSLKQSLFSHEKPLVGGTINCQRGIGSGLVPVQRFHHVDPRFLFLGNCNLDPGPCGHPVVRG
jgi:hypothetical protein